MDIRRAVRLWLRVLIHCRLRTIMMLRFCRMLLLAGKFVDATAIILAGMLLCWHLTWTQHSWTLLLRRKLLKKRQRWYRCLDAGYLSLKVFLLERFLHDILFESSNPQILRDFVGVNSSEPSKLNTKGWTRYQIIFSERSVLLKTHATLFVWSWWRDCCTTTCVNNL